MGFDPAKAARPFAGLATLIVLGCATAGWLAVANFTESTPGAAHGNQVSIASWRASDDEHIADSLQEELPGLLVAHFRVDGSTVHVDAACEQAAEVLVDAYCDEGGRLTGQGADSLVRKLQGAVGAESLVNTVSLAPRTQSAGVGDDRELLVLGAGDGAAQDERVEAALGPRVEVPQVEGASNSLTTRSALVPWISFGLALAASLLVLGCLILLSDRFRGVLAEHRALHLVGLSRRQLRRVAAMLFVVPYITICVAGLLVGACTCLAISGAVGVPWAALLAVVVGVIVGGLIVGLALPRRIRLPVVE
jgi:hypothetical protein